MCSCIPIGVVFFCTLSLPVGAKTRYLFESRFTAGSRARPSSFELLKRLPRIRGPIRGRIPGRIPGPIRGRIPGPIRGRIPGPIRGRIPGPIRELIRGSWESCSACVQKRTAKPDSDGAATNSNRSWRTLSRILAVSTLLHALSTVRGRFGLRAKAR